MTNKQGERQGDEFASRQGLPSVVIFSLEQIKPSGIVGHGDMAKCG